MIGFRTRTVELDDALILHRIEAADGRWLRELGYDTMRTAQQSIRPDAGASRPGAPPHDKTGTLRRFIRYAADVAGGLVIIGPEFLPRKGQDAPRALEHGGVSVNADGESIRIAARPFMAPAFSAAIARALPRLQDSIQGSQP